MQKITKTDQDINVARNLRFNINNVFPGLGTNEVKADAKTSSYTKSGPGRKHKQYKLEERTLKQKQAGMFSRGLHNRITINQAAALLK